MQAGEGVAPVLVFEVAGKMLALAEFLIAAILDALVGPRAGVRVDVGLQLHGTGVLLHAVGPCASVLLLARLGLAAGARGVCHRCLGLVDGMSGIDAVGVRGIAARVRLGIVVGVVLVVLVRVGVGVKAGSLLARSRVDV